MGYLGSYRKRAARVGQVGGVALLASFLNAATLMAGTPPSVPANVSAVVFSPSQVSMEWSASTGSSRVAGYRLYRNGSLLATTAVPYYMDSSAAASTRYTYTVAAYDDAGDVSAQSAPVNVTTPAPGVPATLFGIDQNRASDPWPPTTGQGKRAPAVALRLWLWKNDVKWTDIETCDAAHSTGYAATDPKNPCYSWTNLNTWVRTMAPQAGMDVLYTFGGTPGWATSQVAAASGCNPAGPYSCLPPVDVDKTPGSGLGDGKDTTGPARTRSLRGWRGMPPQSFARSIPPPASWALRFTSGLRQPGSANTSPWAAPPISTS